MSEHCHIGVDIGGTKINMGLMDDRGQRLTKMKIPTAAGLSYEDILDKVLDCVDDMLGNSGLKQTDVASIGFGVPGTVDRSTGTVLFAPNLNWANIPLVQYIEKRSPYHVYISQDTQAAAWGEFLSGAGRGCTEMACITLGTGVGCGIIIGGHIYRGGLNTAGEIGHIVVERGGRLCNCGRRGCLEAYAGGAAMARIASEDLGVSLTTKDIFAMAKAGDEYAIRLIEDATQYIGMGLVSLLNLLSPQKIIISGGMSMEDELFVQPIIRFVKEHGYSLAVQRVAIEKAHLGEDAPMIGAALLYGENLQ
ncbi:ROK family protein [Mahella australiensis]|uniref:ROK family protein n=1 Tax=Mahella australiensis (strain DSM 15567 / CIP 107919 / 50-1 BON) TaxID=697281 RepID=F4A0Q0_MAHA5|nr:ROK family protein [Mahella australiensis]AEE96946.1 ROK family protein [Mahella australiensis 50-1 BON]